MFYRDDDTATLILGIHVFKLALLLFPFFVVFELVMASYQSGILGGISLAASLIVMVITNFRYIRAKRDAKFEGYWMTDFDDLWLMLKQRIINLVLFVWVVNTYMIFPEQPSMLKPYFICVGWIESLFNNVFHGSLFLDNKAGWITIGIMAAIIIAISVIEYIVIGRREEDRLKEEVVEALKEEK